MTSALAPLLIGLLNGLCALARGATVEPGDRLGVGIALEGGVDMPGGHDGTALGVGPGLAIPIRLGIAPSTSVRLSLDAFGLVGHDRVEWTEQTVDWYSDQHRSVYGVGQATAGPEFAFAPLRALHPYIGVEAGLAVVGGWHTFSGGSASLRDGGAATQRDTLQVVPAIGGDVGLRLKSPSAGVRGVAVEVEAGYTVSFLPEAPLGEVPTAFEASRTAIALDRVRLGFGVSFPLL